MKVLCNSSLSQRGLAKGGAQRFMVFSSPMLRLDMTLDASITSSIALQRSAEVSGVSRVSGASKTPRIVPLRLTSKAMPSNALVRMLSTPRSMIQRQSLATARSSQHLLDKASDQSKCLTVPIRGLNLGKCSSVEYRSLFSDRLSVPTLQDGVLRATALFVLSRIHSSKS